MRNESSDDRFTIDFATKKPVDPADIDPDAPFYTSVDQALASIPKGSKKKTFAFTNADKQVFINATSKQAAKNHFLDVTGILCRPVKATDAVTYIGTAAKWNPSDIAINAMVDLLISAEKKRMAQEQAAEEANKSKRKRNES